MGKAVIKGHCGTILKDTSFLMVAMWMWDFVAVLASQIEDLVFNYHYTGYLNSCCGYIHVTLLNQAVQLKGGRKLPFTRLDTVPCKLHTASHYAKICWSVSPNSKCWPKSTYFLSKTHQWPFDTQKLPTAWVGYWYSLYKSHIPSSSSFLSRQRFFWKYQWRARHSWQTCNPRYTVLHPSAISLL
jgi:hypothetical protein